MKVAASFKSDDSFLRKLAVGAAGTNATMSRLRDLGFDPIELERGSTGFKIWKRIKIKRVRVPDILCLKTGRRFESRGKTKLEISMSHSLKDPRRAWNAGMRDDDLVSIVMFDQNEVSPLNLQQVSPVHFVRVQDLRHVFDLGQVEVTTPKGVEEGSEIRVIWTCATANEDGVIVQADAKSIRVKPNSGARTQFIRCIRRGGAVVLSPQAAVGAAVRANQIVASVVPVTTDPPCPAPVDENYFTERLGSVNLSERYAAAKALRYRGYTSARTALESRVEDADEDIYVKLEAAWP